MTKILKNTTGLDKVLNEVGQTIPASSQLLLNTTDYALYAAPEAIAEITPLINAGDLVVNNGINDLTPARGINFLKYPDQAANQTFELATTTITTQEALEQLISGVGIKSPARLVWVAKNGDDVNGEGTVNNPFLTVEEAIDFVSNNLSPGVNNSSAIIVAPGQYTENPLILPDFTKLIGYGDSITEFVAANSNADFLTLGREADVFNIRVSGVTGSGFACIRINNTTGNNFRNIIKDCQFSASSIGVAINSTTITTASAVSGCRFSALTETGFLVQEKSNCTLNNILANSPLATIASVSTESSLTISAGRVINCAVGVEVFNDGRAVISGFDLSQISGVPIRSSSSTGQIRLLNCIYDESNIEVDDLRIYQGSIVSTEDTEEKVSLSEELSVGFPELGRESALGEGDSFIRGMLVYEFNGTTFIDVSDNAKFITNPSVQIPGTVINNSLYISCKLNDTVSGDFYKFLGIRVDVVQASVGGELVIEYWDGSAWSEINHMSTQAAGKYLPFAKQLFQRTGREHVRFDPDILLDWTKNDPISSGIDRYWVRVRVVSTLTTVPQIDKIKLHSNRTEINDDGFIEYFGLARPLRALNFTYNNFRGANDSPVDQDIYLDDVLATGRVENQFSDNGTLNSSDKVALTEYLPIDIDTSAKVKVFLTFATTNSPSGTDTVVFRFYWGSSNDLDNIYEIASQAPSSIANRKEINAQTDVTLEDAQYTITVDLDFSDFISRDSTNIGDLVWIAFRRNNSPDTYNHPVNLVNLRFLYAAANNGGHL